MCGVFKNISWGAVRAGVATGAWTELNRCSPRSKAPKIFPQQRRSTNRAWGRGKGGMLKSKREAQNDKKTASKRNTDQIIHGPAAHLHLNRLPYFKVRTALIQASIFPSWHKTIIALPGLTAGCQWQLWWCQRSLQQSAEGLWGRLLEYQSFCTPRVYMPTAAHLRHKAPGMNISSETEAGQVWWCSCFHGW